MLNPNRNPGWTEDRAEAALKQAFNVSRVIWLGDGLKGVLGDRLIDHPGARLWQLDANVGAEKLTMEFGALGLGKERLWWSERKPLGEHLARINSMAARWSASVRPCLQREAFLLLD